MVGYAISSRSNAVELVGRGDVDNAVVGESRGVRAGCDKVGNSTSGREGVDRVT